MEKRKRNPTAENSERKVEQLQRKVLAEQEKRKKPGECLKVCTTIHTVVLSRQSIVLIIGVVFSVYLCNDRPTIGERKNWL